jgi:hypothetical protein
MRNKDSMKCAGFENGLSSGGFSGQVGKWIPQICNFLCHGKEKTVLFKRPGVNCQIEQQLSGV